MRKSLFCTIALTTLAFAGITLANTSFAAKQCTANFFTLSGHKQTQKFWFYKGEHLPNPEGTAIPGAFPDTQTCSQSTIGYNNYPNTSKLNHRILNVSYSLCANGASYHWKINLKTHLVKQSNKVVGYIKAYCH